MFTINLKRVIKAGFYSFLRNGFVSFSSIFVMIVTLSVIASLMFGSAILNATLSELKSKVDLNVYFIHDARENDILAIKKTIETLPEVNSVTYISQEDVLANFKERHKNDQFTIQALDELDYNPLGATLNVKTKEPSQYEGVAQFLQGKNILSSEGVPIVDKVNYYQNKTAIDKLGRIIDSSERAGFIAAIILIILSILITFNTIRLVIYISREEISVMRLVGASALYVRGPFVAAGILYGIVAGLITLALFFPVTLYLGRFTENFFVGFNIFEYYTSHFGTLFALVVGSGILIGAISSYLAVKKFLKT